MLAAGTGLKLSGFLGYFFNLTGFCQEIKTVENSFFGMFL